MLSCDFSFPNKPLINPSFSSSQWTFLQNLPNPLFKTVTLIRPNQKNSKFLPIQSISQNPNFQISPNNAPRRRNPSVSAGRSKKTPGGPSTGRIEGNAEVRREAKKNARRKSQKLAENLFYRLKSPNRNQADNFSEEELEMIGLGYDRMVRFMEKDDPNLRHPYDWYKYGEYGPYSWRGIVVGDPIRGRFSDECVTMIGEVKSHEEWEEIEKFDMATDFSVRLNSLDKKIGFKHFWVFVRHPKWKVTELPWQQWTLVSEVVVESGEKRLDKWNLMGRLGNRTRSLITQCAAWMRPDIIYVKRPVYQCRFEPQTDFFKGLGPLLDPSTEQNFLFELKHEDGRVELCTYFGGLCKIVRINPKSFVDDVVNAYEKMNDEKKSKCLEFLLSNHPTQLLHPYTKEWKAKLEEMELGCDAPDEDEDGLGNTNEREIVDWIEDDDEEDDFVIEDVEGEDEDEELGTGEEEESAEENEKYWEEEFNKALRSSEAMENLVTRSVEASTEFYKKQMKTMEDEKKGKYERLLQMREREEERDGEEGEENLNESSRKEKFKKEEWKYVGSGPNRRKIKKSRIPPELFLRAAVRPFTYRNLVKEIVLMRHAIIDGEISGKG
ncbi:hypothetical protein BVC80_8925g18 [Macleaya cordata]|uniref:Uncharacterized protein n=1 Tax=Macleaya cordata TaxID=56857 RepID=A0A200PXR4_MACCD|nr:hypothetical protein BVC80_8925g18 [Macleaya cordata]